MSSMHPTPPPASPYPTGASASTQKSQHLWEYWGIVYKYIWLVVVTLFVSVIVAAIITQQQKKLYRASAVLELSPPPRYQNTAAPTILFDDHYLETQLAKLRMTETLKRAVEGTNLKERKDFQGMTDAEVVRLFAGNVTVSKRRTNYLVDLGVTGSDPKMLDDVTNALAETFREMQRSETKQRRIADRAKLEEDIAQANTKIRLFGVDKRGSLEMADFTESTFKAEYERIQKSRETYTLELDATQLQLMKQEADYKQMIAALADPEKGPEVLLAHPMILRDRIVEERQADLQSLKRRLQEFEEVLDRGPEHPENMALRGLIGETEAKLHERVRILAVQFTQDHESMEQNVSRLTESIDGLTSQLRRATDVKAKVDQINAEIQRHTEDKQRATVAYEKLQPLSGADEDAVKVVTLATEPTTPFRPNKAMNMTLGVLLGLVGGIALAFFANYLDHTIRTKEDLQRHAGDIPLLGIIPNIPARKTEVVTKDLYASAQPKSTVSEAYRGVRTSLTLSSRGPVQRVLLLTSAGPREGKTTTAINLATVLAYGGARTLVIDGDLRKPRIHKSFSVPNTRGLTNLIVGTDDPIPYCQKSVVEGVDILPSGPIPPNPSELLGRPRMREILTRLRGKYDHVIVDTPPVGAVTDAVVLSTVVDGVILVVHAGKTKGPIVARGLEQLRYVHAHIVGVVLNNQRASGKGYGAGYGYYHYYYYYTSHYGHDERPKRGGRKKPGTLALETTSTAIPTAELTDGDTEDDA